MPCVSLLSTGQHCPYHKQKATTNLSNPQSEGPTPKVKCTVPGHFRQPLSQPAKSSGYTCRGCVFHHVGDLMALRRVPSAWLACHPGSQAPCPGKQRQPSQPGERLPSQHLLLGLQQQQGKKKKKKINSRPSKLSSMCLRLLLGQMTNATVFRLLSSEVFCWVRMLSTQVHTNLSI